MMFGRLTESRGLGMLGQAKRAKGAKRNEKWNEQDTNRDGTWGDFVFTPCHVESPIRSSESSEGEESEVGASEVSKRTIEKRPSQRRTFATESCRMVKMTRSRTEENRSQKMSESEQNAWVLQFCMNQNASTLDQMVKVFNMQEKKSRNAVAPDAAEEIPEEAKGMGTQFSLTEKHPNSDHPERGSWNMLWLELDTAWASSEFIFCSERLGKQKLLKSLSSSSHSARSKERIRI